MRVSQPISQPIPFHHTIIYYIEHDDEHNIQMCYVGIIHTYPIHRWGKFQLETDYKDVFGKRKKKKSQMTNGIIPRCHSYPTHVNKHAHTHTHTLEQYKY